MSVIDEIWGLASWVEDAAKSIWGIITSVYGIVDTIYSIASDFIQLFPPPLQAVLITGILLSLAFYVYNNYISGIQVAGFKLP